MTNIKLRTDWKLAKICYWKPIQTGIEEDNDTLTVKNLAKLSDKEIFDVGFRLEKPLSPHLSARLANVEITVDKVLNLSKTLKATSFTLSKAQAEF